MKKLFFSAIMIAMATTSFAQDIAKQLKGKSYDEAMTTLNSALPSLSAEQKAKGYNAVVDIVYPLASKAFDTATLNQASGKNDPVDYEAIMNAIKAGMACDPYDNEPNDKGKVAPKFHKKNQDRLQAMRPLLVTQGQNYLNEDNATAMKFLGLYVESSASSLFAEVAGDKDAYAAPVARVCAYIKYQDKDYAAGIKYAKIAMKSADVREDAEPIYVACLEKQCVNKQDTLNFINELKQLNPQKYFATMASYYNRIGETELASKLIDEELAANPGNKMAWATKGEAAMNARDWDEAITCFKKAVEIDPQFTAVWFNLGVCSSSKGFDMNEKFSDKQGRIKTEDADKVTAQLKEAITFYEKVRELDPNHETIPQWPLQLRMLYNNLGMSDKAAEISTLLGE